MPAVLAIFLGLDPLYYVAMAPALLLGLYAQWLVKSRVNGMAKVPNQAGLTGEQVAIKILEANGIGPSVARHQGAPSEAGAMSVRVEAVQGWLSDHYSPGEKILRLSPEIFSGRSISSLAIAAHEVGHAIQDAKGYPALVLRSTIAPICSWGSNLGMILIPIGFMLGSLGMIKIGLVLFAAMVFFSLVTLPVEFDASARAVAELERLGLARGEDRNLSRKVLNAAALTYVASAVSAILQLLYFAWRAGLLGGRSNDRAEA